MIVVTGATDGIGYETVKELLGAGVPVIGIGRDAAKIEHARHALTALFPDAAPEYLLCDLSTGEGIISAASNIARLAGSVGALLHVAGAVSGRRAETPEGFEQTFATNHLAPYRLTRALMPLLAPGARVITVSSNSHRGARIYWDDVMLAKNYHILRAYKQSKLANVLFTMELQRRFGQRLRPLAFDPGLMRTKIGLKNAKPLERFAWRIRMLQAQDPSVAGRFLAEMALDSRFDSPDGLYYRLGVNTRPYAKATSADAQRLWALSARICGIDESWE